MQNLSCTSPDKEILKLDSHEIGLIAIFRDFVKAQKLGLSSNFCPITFKEFNNFWSKQPSMKRRSSVATIADLLNSSLPSNL